MDDLKNKIKVNLDLFEEQDLSPDHLKKFESRLEELHPKVFKLRDFLKYAALFLLPIAIATAIFLQDSATQKTDAVAEVERQSAFPLAEAEMYFKQTISKKQQSLVNQYSDSESKEVVEEYQNLITELEEQYLQLEKDLAISGDERIVVAMIKNYKTRIELLEELILQLNYINHLKKQNHENPNA